MAELAPMSKLPGRLVVIAGTYDGVVAGWDTEIQKTNNEGGSEESEQNNARKHDRSLLDMLNSKSGQTDENSYLKMNFAMAVHEGSVRCLSVTPTRKQGKKEETSSADDNENILPGMLLSAGYDESLAIFSLTKQTQAGELKTPSNLGTPTCSSFAPSNHVAPTHVLLGLSSGKIVIYRKRDWSVQHILPGHDEKGVNCIAVHPSGKMALSGGRDGKICLWDLMRGRLAFVHKVPSVSKGRKSTVNDIIWSSDGKRYAYCTHEGNVTAREMASGDTLLDINLPKTGRPNQICFIGGEDGLFLAAACNDGGLPVFAVGSVDDEDEETGTRRALMAIEPVVGVATAGDDRFKCIRGVAGGSGFLVITANSGGIISLIDLEGAARMMLDDGEAESEQIDEQEGSDKDDYSSDEDSDGDVELAADILESVRLGSGARITSLTVWSRERSETAEDEDEDEDEELQEDAIEESTSPQTREEDESSDEETAPSKKRKSKTVSISMKGHHEIEMDEEALEKARALVSQAKKRQKRKSKKKKD